MVGDYLRRQSTQSLLVVLLAFVGSSLSLASSAAAELDKPESAKSALVKPAPVKIASRGDTNAKYAIDMIKLALSKVNVPYELAVREAHLSTMRLREGLDNDEIDIIWTATNSKMEENYQPIRVPLYKGLLGYRILIVHKDNKHMFDDVHTMDDVLKHSYGQGFGWTDTTIMQASGLEVVTTPKYHGLFHMADGQRFDGFPRGVHEPWSEVASRPQLDLTIDENVMFVYKMPYYLFVSNHRPELALDLRKGFEIAIADGSFDRQFFQDPTVRMVMEKAKLDQRRVFNLINPDLPAETPLDRKELWFDVNAALLSARTLNEG